MNGLQESAITNGVASNARIAALPMATILDRINGATDGWPRRVGQDLFVHVGGVVNWLADTSALFGWLQSRTGVINWHKASGCPSKGEVFAELKRTAQSYTAVETLPHEPPIAGHYYACTMPEPGDGSALNALVSRFNPATDIDGDLIRAMLATPFWGGAGGTRPAFVLTSDAGRGVGKTTLATTVAYLTGGAVELSANEDADVVKQRLLSSEGMARRIVLLDNVKTLRFSWAELEALITAPIISGKRMYVGEGTRPNCLTWLITLNGVSLGTDMTQRAVVIKLSKPEHRGAWAEETYRYIDDHRPAIIADCIGLLRAESSPLAKQSRWSAWESNVLTRLPEPSDAQAAILDRQQSSDVEAEEGDIIEGFIRDQLDRMGYDADADRVRIPAKIIADWFKVATGENKSTVAICRTLNQAANEGRLKRLCKDPCKTFGRCFLWTGDNADLDAAVRNDLQDRLDRKHGHHSGSYG